MISAFQHFKISAFGLALAWLWFVLINDLRVEWTVNPQYGYGWAVPFLCAYLIWQKAKSRKQKCTSPLPSPRSGERVSIFYPPSSIFYFVLVLCALLYAPTRLIEEANPGWRLISWALALEVVGLTLCFLRLMTADGRRQAEDRQKADIRPLSSVFRPPFSALVFPICFFLVAVPWPTGIEQFFIQGFTRLDAGATVELLGWFGIPAIPHGNVIEVATGVVGIDEACSGIRSFQATLMISLFLGEFYRLSVRRRVGLCLAGFALSLLFNLGRMTLLVWVAAKQGVAAIASWHDPAGVTILVACFFSLWGLAVGMGKAERLKTKMLPGEIERQILHGPGKTETLKTESKPVKAPHVPLPSIIHSSSALRPLAIALIFWLAAVEISVEWWYRSHAERVPAAAQWTIAWPVNQPAFKELPLPERTRQILRYDEGRSANWSAGDLTWQVIFLRWKPGRTAIHLAQNHTPEVCMTAAGHTLKSLSPQAWLDVNGLRLPFLAYQVTDAPQPFYVFYCLWDDRASAQGFQTMGLTYGNRLAAVLAGQRNPGQRSLEIAVTGPASAAAAEADLRAELEKLVTVPPDHF